MGDMITNRQPYQQPTPGTNAPPREGPPLLPNDDATHISPAEAQGPPLLPNDDATHVASRSQAEWPPNMVSFPSDPASGLRQASDKMDRDLRGGAPPQTIKQDAAKLQALMALEKVRDEMDKAMLKAFDEALASARKMMEQYKEWLQKVKLPEEQLQKQALQQKEAARQAQKLHEASH